MDMKRKLAGLKALVIVAHPDDETIWLGGFISRHPGIKWTIFSLSRASDNDRLQKFLRVCRYFNAKPIIADVPDEGDISLKKLTPLI